MVTKAALVSLAGGFLGALPNIIVFQYNPAELARSLQQRRAPACGGGEPTQAEAFRVDGPPQETITLKAEFDGGDLALDGNPVVPFVGIRPALAALELLLYAKDQQLANPLAAVAPAGSFGIPPDELPLVLFVWGPGRVLPVRLTALNIREQEFDGLLNPLRAEVDLTLEIQKRLPADHAARGVYNYTERQMRAVARLQLLNNVQSVLGGLSIL
ncbi:MAG: hypothetical protein U0935_13105 [Pirellulales bacterium]